MCCLMEHFVRHCTIIDSLITDTSYINHANNLRKHTGDLIYREERTNTEKPACRPFQIHTPNSCLTRSPRDCRSGDAASSRQPPERGALQLTLAAGASVDHPSSCSSPSSEWSLPLSSPFVLPLLPFLACGGQCAKGGVSSGKMTYQIRVQLHFLSFKHER